MARIHRRLRLVAALFVLAACSRELPPLEPATGISPMPRQRTISRSDRLAGELAHVDAKVDGWITEAFDRAATKQLEEVGKLLPDSTRLADDAAAARITGDFSCTELRPAQCRTVYSGAGLEIVRGDVGGEKLQGASGFVKALRGLAAPYGPEADIHVSAEIVRVDTSDDRRFVTGVRFEAWANGDGGCVQQDCDWTVEWEWPDHEAPPRMSSIAVTRFSENRAPRTLYSDCTASVIGATKAWNEQLLRGTDDWCARIDIAAGMNQYAHNGLAIGDVDGDGLEDVYVCQSGGLPNRLFKHRPDGTAIDISADARVDWLNDSTGALFVDLDNDGKQDLLLSTDRNLLVMRGNGAGEFELKSEFPLLGGYSLAAADYDNDGLLDVYVCRYNTSETSIGLPSPYHDAKNGPPNALLRNTGGFAFAEVTKAVGLAANNRRFSFAAGWADYDEDGDLDLYVSNDFGRKNLYRNDGGHFKDVANDAGVDDIGAGMGASWGDFDGDGHLDLYGSNMYSAAGQRISYQRKFKPTTEERTRAGYQRHARGNSLFRNKGDGTFEDVTLSSGTAMGRWAWGAQFCDVDNDGREDIYVPNGFMTNEDTQDLASYFWRRVTAQSPMTESLTTPYADGWGVINRSIREGKSWAGREPNTMYLNLGDGTFADVSFTSGIAFPDDARCFAMVDWDQDGDLDFWIANRTAPRVRFVRNDSDGSNRWVAFHLTGTKVNRDAIGARVDVTSHSKRQVRILQAGSGYLSQSSKWLCFGVGSSERLDDVMVKWTDGSTSRFTDVETNQRYAITQGEKDLAVVKPAAGTAVKLAPSTPVPIEPTEIARIGISTRVAVPPLSLKDYDGKTHVLGTGKRPLLVNFWSSACASCMNELDGWSRAERELTSAGLAILALSVDDTGSGARTSSSRDAIARLRPWFAAGPAPDDWLETFEILQRSLLDRHRRLPLPCSFLIDEKGRLAYMYKGPVDVHQLVEDVGHLKLEGVEFALANAPFGGRWHHGPGSPRLFETAGMFHDRGQPDQAMFYLEEARKIVGLPGSGGPAQRQLSDSQLRAGVTFLEQKRFEDAERVLRQAIAYNENDALPWYALGQSLYSRDRMDEAQKCYERAVELDPGLAEAWNMLGAVRFAQQNEQGALEAYQHAVESDPTLSEAWFALGVYYITTEKFAAGVESFRKLVALRPDMSLGWTGLGNCLLMTGDKPKAIAALQRALQLDPTNERAKGLLEQAGAAAEPPQ